MLDTAVAYNLTKFSVDIWKFGTPTVNLTAVLYLADSAAEYWKKPTGSPLANSTDINATTLATSDTETYTNFVFPIPYTLNTGTYYVMTILSSTLGTIDDSNCYYMDYATTYPTVTVPHGNFVSYGLSQWNGLGQYYAMTFKLYGEAIPTLKINCNIPLRFSIGSTKYTSNTTIALDPANYTIILPNTMSFYDIYVFANWTDGYFQPTRIVDVNGTKPAFFNVTYVLASADLQPPADIGNIVASTNSSVARREQDKSFFSFFFFWAVYMNRK